MPKNGQKIGQAFRKGHPTCWVEKKRDPRHSGSFIIEKKETPGIPDQPLCTDGWVGVGKGRVEGGESKWWVGGQRSGMEGGWGAVDVGAYATTEVDPEDSPQCVYA